MRNYAIADRSNDYVIRFDTHAKTVGAVLIYTGMGYEDMVKQPSEGTRRSEDPLFAEALTRPVTT